MILEQPRKKKTGIGVCSSQRVAFACDDCGHQGTRAYAALISSTHHRCKSCATSDMNRNRPAEQKAAMVEAAAKVWRGRTREEVMGAERREIERRLQSERNSGPRNPNYGGKYSRGFADRPLVGCWESLFGAEKASEMKAQASARNSGSNNPMYGKPSPKASGNGISGWWKDTIYFRSLLELAFILKCESAGKRISSAESASFRFNYTDTQGKRRTYTPDFVDENGVLFEIKPVNLINSASNTIKRAAAPDVVWITDAELNRPSLEELEKLITDGCVRIDQSKERKIDEYRKTVSKRHRR